MIDLMDITKKFTDKTGTKEVLKGVNLHIEKGEMIAVMGRSGVGKSSLLHILAGLEKATSGNYLFEQQKIDGLNTKQVALWRKDNIGFILQNYALIDEKNIFDNIALPLLYSGKSKKEITIMVVSLMQKLGIVEKLNNFPKQLSGGQAQRVAIARALINKPKLIIADEPTGSLDEETEKDILEIFKAVNRQGNTIIMVTHDKEVAGICNRIFNLHNGILEERF